jgi:G:T/U-mismatch repair DNA glycosylase
MAFVETHPFNDEDIPKGTRALIVGTAPPPRFSDPNCAGKDVHRLDFPFFYGSGRNNFWKFMNAIADHLGTPLPSDEGSAELYAEEARVFLKRYGLWMKDALQTYERTHECSSLDRYLQPQIFTDFLQVFGQHLEVRKVAFTSTQAAKWTFSSLNREDVQRQFFDTLAARKTRSDVALDFNVSSDCKVFAARFLAPVVTVRFNDRDVQFFQLPSPSSSRHRPKGATNTCLIEIFRTVLFSEREEHAQTSTSFDGIGSAQN